MRHRGDGRSRKGKNFHLMKMLQSEMNNSRIIDTRTVPHLSSQVSGGTVLSNKALIWTNIEDIAHENYD